MQGVKQGVFLQGGGEAKGNEEFQADAVCLLSWVCFIKPVAPEIPPFFLFSNHQSVSDSFPDQSEDGKKGCCVPEVSWQLTRQSQFPTPPIYE